MPPSLAHFPREILAKITAHLSDSDIVLRLYGCGDSTLTNKLKTGGVTSFFFQGCVLPQSRIDFIKSLQLESFIVSGRSDHEELGRELAQGLSPSLRHLYCNNLDPQQVCLTLLFEDQVPNFSPLPLPIRLYDSPVWIVRNSYPRLESLSYFGSSEEPHLIVEFLAGLPDTLVTLSSTDVASHFINALSLLPPHLSHLRMTSSLDSLDLFSNLASLYVFMPEEASRQLHLELGHWSNKTLAPLTARGSQLPASLTHLNITCDFEEVKNLLCPSPPPKLATLHIGANADPSGDVIDLLFSMVVPMDDLEAQAESPEAFFGIVPPTVTDLVVVPWTSFGSTHLDVMNDYGDNSASKVDRAARGASKLIRPFIKSLRISLQGIKNEHTYSDIISMTPNVEVFSLKARRSTLLGFDQIRCFNGALLRDLSAPISSECFKIGSDGTYPLASLLPRLETLFLRDRKLTEDGDAKPAEDFDFGGIPPSVTSFYSSMHGHSSRTLHLLPPSVTAFRITSSVNVSIEAENFDQLFRSPPPLASESGQLAASDTTARVVLYLSKVSRLYRLGDGKLVCSHVELKDSLGLFFLSWPTKLPFELLLGCSEASLNGFKFDSPLPTTLPANLPSLTKLIIDSDQSPWSDLKALPALTDLEMKQFVNFADVAAIAPNLTRLSCIGTDLPMSLPRTLKSLACKHMTPLALARLDLLEEWTQFDPDSNREFLDWRGAIPTSVTKLQIPWRHLYHDADRCWSREEISIHLVDRLPGLKHLDLGRNIPHTLVEALCDTVPSYVRLEARSFVTDDASNFSLIANRIGLCHGGLELMPYESLLEATTRVGLRAYERLNCQTFRTDFLPYWPSLCPYLSANTTLLEVSDFSGLIGDDGLVILPPTVTTLICKHLRQIPAKPAVLPPQLRKLVIKTTVRTVYPGQTIVLPSGLTHLDVDRLEVCDDTFVWPSNLTFLRRLVIDEEINEVLRALPPSLKYLCLCEVSLCLPHFLLLPQGLKRYEGDVKRSHQHSFIAYALRAGLTWIGKELDGNFNFESSLDMLAAKPSIN